jgi:hypothetical protein
MGQDLVFYSTAFPVSFRTFSKNLQDHPWKVPTPNSCLKYILFDCKCLFSVNLLCLSLLGVNARICMVSVVV